MEAIVSISDARHHSNRMKDNAVAQQLLLSIRQLRQVGRHIYLYTFQQGLAVIKLKSVVRGKATTKEGRLLGRQRQGQTLCLSERFINDIGCVLARNTLMAM